MPPVRPDTTSTPIRKYQSLLIPGLTSLALLAFAANSLLTRFALQATPIDPATFSAVRLLAGAITLGLIVLMTGARMPDTRTGMRSGALLFLYVAAFSYAYRDLETGAGALVLFVSAQLLMIAVGLARGERTNRLGVGLAVLGLLVFLAPSPTAPPVMSTTLMVLAGLAWGGFSLLGKAGASPIASTAASFIWAVPLAGVLLLVQWSGIQPSVAGMCYAGISGALTSALGYVIWYWVRVRMSAISAGTVQLAVPVISALLGAMMLDEQVSLRSGVSAVIVLLGIALTVRAVKRDPVVDGT